jgi:hypothetical protein
MEEIFKQFLKGIKDDKSLFHHIIYIMALLPLCHSISSPLSPSRIVDIHSSQASLVEMAPQLPDIS